MNSTDKKQVFLVEDDRELALLIQEYLQTMEFTVEVEENGLKAEAYILSNPPDLVILDLMLPGKDGISICRQIRKQYHGGIIMLTASGESVDHVLGLELGADDYLTKPVEPRVLLAHARAVLRRLESQPRSSTTHLDLSTYQLKGFVVNFESRKVTLDGKNIEFTVPEYDLLELLVKNRGTVLSRDEMLSQLRGIEYDGLNRFIDITVSQIRAKLTGDSEINRHIKTVRSKGYLFAEDI